MKRLLTKRLLVILGILVIVGGAGGFFVRLGTAKADTVKKVEGATSDLPEPDSRSLIPPPQKAVSFYNPSIYSKASILIDDASSTVLFEKNANLKVPIASTTKIMTATVVLDDYTDRLDDVVTITPAMINVEGSDIQLRVGEKIKVKDLLKGLLIMSGNDTAYALALHFGGKDAFVNKMNEKAAFLGLSSTHYKCPAGLDDDGYSTAHDLVFLSSYALKNPSFAQIVSTSQTTISSTDGRIIHDLKNSNRMLQPDDPSYYPIAVGVKTGFTYAAGHCLIFSGVQDKHRLIGAVLNTDENTITASAKEGKKLLSWGFANWVWN